MTSAERAKYILQVLDAAQSNVFPSEADIETMGPAVDLIRGRYEELRGRGFHSAYITSRVEFITQAITQAQNDKLEEAERAILNEHSMAEPDDLNIGLLRAARAVKALRLSTAKKD